MNKKHVGKILLIFLSIVLVIIAVFTATYAIFTTEIVAPNPNDYTTGTLSITASSKSNNLSLTSAIPMTDENGASTEPYIFTVKNNGNVSYKFNIKLNSTASNSLSSQYIKLKVDNDNPITLPTNGIIKENVVVEAGKTVDISIRAWLSINTPKTFNSQLVVDGVAVYK